MSEPMLERARRTATSLPARIELWHADAADTGDPAASFDAAILSLVLSVVPDPGQVLAETLRVLKPDGRLVVFDKFAPDDQPSLLRGQYRVVLLARDRESDPRSR